MKVNYDNKKEFYQFIDACEPLVAECVKAGIDLRITRSKSNPNGTYKGHLYSKAMNCDFPLYDTEQLEELLSEWLEMQDSE
jgi:hypothetical protein